VRDGLIDRLSSEEILLYLFLVCVADGRGLSYYGDRRIPSQERVGKARDQRMGTPRGRKDKNATTTESPAKAPAGKGE